MMIGARKDSIKLASVFPETDRRPNSPVWMLCAFSVGHDEDGGAWD